MLRKKILGWFYKLRGITPVKMPMVQYWMHRVSVEARVVNRGGSLEMDLEGERYPIRGLPRGHILFGKLSKLKHEIKNQIFNQSWHKLEAGEDKQVIINEIKDSLKNGIYPLLEDFKYDLEPQSKLVPPVREIHKAFTKVARNNAFILRLRDVLCEIIQEDDSYRYRVQWLAEWFPLWFKWMPERYFREALEYLEHAEVVGDMKERIRLLRRILLLILEDKQVNRLFKEFIKEVNWKKVRMTPGDKFHFRGKYFKVDYGIFDY